VEMGIKYFTVSSFTVPSALGSLQTSSTTLHLWPSGRQGAPRWQNDGPQTLPGYSSIFAGRSLVVFRRRRCRGSFPLSLTTRAKHRRNSEQRSICCLASWRSSGTTYSSSSRSTYRSTRSAFTWMCPAQRLVSQWYDRGRGLSTTGPRTSRLTGLYTGYNSRDGLFNREFTSQEADCVEGRPAADISDVEISR